MLDLINRYLTSLGMDILYQADYDEILGLMSLGHTVAAIKRLRELTKKKQTHFFQSRDGSLFSKFLIAEGVDYLTLEVNRMGLKEAKDVIDFVADNWVIRHAE